MARRTVPVHPPVRDTCAVTRGAETAGSRPLDVFISYSRADEKWAAWIADTLEAAGYRTMLQAWDFVPGTNFIEFIDRGISESSLVLAVLSRSYLQSRYGRIEWQAAWQATETPAAKLVTVRVEDCDLRGLLATITYVDLVGIEDGEHADELLLQRIQEALDGRARPARSDDYPPVGPASSGADRAIPPSQQIRPARPPADDRHRQPGPAMPGRSVQQRPVRGGHRRSVTAAPYPAAIRDRGERSSITVLHVTGPALRAGRGEAAESSIGANLVAQVLADVTELVHGGAPDPDLIVVTGDLTATGGRKEFEAARAFLTRLQVGLRLGQDRLIVVPGGKDVTRAMSQAYFNECDADDLTPVPPYWPKWRNYSRLFQELYEGVDGVVFDQGQPWTLFPVPELQVVIAGLNTTMAVTHRSDDQYAAIQTAQANWFAQQLRAHERAGWLRLGVLRDAPGSWPGALRDGDTFTRLVAPRLNLLIHGPASKTAEFHQLTPDLPAVSVAGEGRIQLLSLTAAGLTRWRAPDHALHHGHDRSPGHGPDHGPDGTPSTTDRTWPGTEATFSTPMEPILPEEIPVIEEVRATADPLSQFLGHVEEVCRVRYEGARVSRVASDPPYLLVSYAEDGFPRLTGVGAVLGEPTFEHVEGFLRIARGANPDLALEMVFTGTPPLPALRQQARRAGVRLRSFAEFQGLVDLTGYVETQTARLAGDPQYPPDLYVPQRFRELDRPEQPVREGLVEALMHELGEEHGRFILVLGDFGRGKTFALREVAQRIPMELPQLVPIFIELRALDKAHSIEGLVASHLADTGEQNIDLRAFGYMLRQGRIVLIFDGFDELVTRTTYERAADHLETLLQAATGNAKIIVSSRTQHFRSSDQVMSALGDRVGLLPQRRLLAVEEFTPNQIRTYLVNHYRGDEQAAQARLRLISGVPNLIDLAHNPRMLSFIADLAQDRLLAVARVGRALSAAALYREILSAWLAVEERRTRDVPGAPAGLGIDDLWHAVTRLALRLWESNESVLRVNDIAEVADTVAGMAEGTMSGAQATHALGAGTLLVRTEDGLFGFIHGSVIEWLVANEIAARLARGDDTLLSQRPLSPLSIEFLCDLADVRTCEDWVARVLPDPQADDVARHNAGRVSTRLRIPAHTDLRGASLAGEDLSYRDLGGVDLTGADLTDARLVGANLAGAVLRNAKLPGARLDEATLTGADLRGADLSRTRMIRTDLRDVQISGSHWSRAALIAATIDGKLAGAPELHGAAIAPGAAVGTELAPAGIGVPYGFHIKFGRLPSPVAYTGDGSTLAVGCDNGSVLICDTVSGLPVRTLSGHRGRVYAVLGSTHDGLLSAGSDGYLRMWDAATGAQRWSRPDYADWVWPVVISHDGYLIATSDSSGAVQLLDAVDGGVRHELGGMRPPVWTAAFSPDDRLLAVGASGGSVRVWETAAGRLVHRLEGHSGSAFRVAFDPSGDLLATADESGVVRLWDAHTGELRRELTGHPRSVYALDFHPGGGLLASADTGGTVRLWRVPDGRPAGILTVHTSSVYQVLFGVDGRILVTLDSGGSVRMWSVRVDAEDAAHLHGELRGHRAAVWPGAFRPDGTQFATASNDGTVRLWEIATGRCQHVLSGHGRRVTSISFSRDGARLAACGNDGVVRVWQPTAGQLLGQVTGGADTLVSCVFNPVEPLLAAASNDGGVHLFGTGEAAGAARELDVETDNVWAESFSPDGRILATANDDDTVGLWFHLTGAQGHTLAEHRGRVRSIAFAPDGVTLATGCDDRKVRLYDVDRGEQLAELVGHLDRVYSVAYNRDGSWLASASWDGTLRVWECGPGRAGGPGGSPAGLRHTLTGHVGRLWTTAFHPSADVIAGAGDDSVISLWDARSGRRRHALTGHTGRIYAVSFSPDGTLLASGGDDGTVRLWDTTDLDAPALRATLLGTAEGWAALSPDGRYKSEGALSRDFWHAVGMCRFEAGELDEYLPQLIQRLPADAPL
jgi:WD40 repeat protein